MPSPNAIVEASKTPKTWGSTGVTGLVLHNPTRTYYHRYSLRGNRTYRSLETKRFSTAKLRLAGKAGDVEAARQVRDADTDNLRTLADFERLLLSRLESSTKHAATKRNTKLWLDRLRKVAPEIFSLMADRVTAETLMGLRKKLQGAKFKKGGRGQKGGKVTTGYKPAVINQTLGVVKTLLDLAREKRVIFTDPFKDQRAVFGAIFLPKERSKLKLPTHWDMERIFAEVGKPQPHPLPYLSEKFEQFAADNAERVQFLAFSGMRLQEGNAATWDDVSEHRMKVRGTKSASSDRVIPIIPALAKLLDQMRERRRNLGLPLGRGPILRGKSSLAPLARACARLKLPKLTQHGLRHYFATICIESGVDVPTVSKWLGHADGGAIAMKVYGHLRDEHSISAAQRVTFGVAQAGPAVGIKTS